MENTTTNATAHAPATTPPPLAAGEMISGAARIEAVEQSSHRELTIQAAHTGTGIALEAAGQLFQPFVATKSHGLGVGPSMSRTIVEPHGGRIWVELNPAGGTIFRFPLRTVHQEDIHDGC